MKLGGTDPNLRSQSQFEPVTESRGGVYQHRRRRNLFEKSLGVGVILRDDGICMRGAVTNDVRNRLVESAHDPHGQDQIQVFGEPVGLSGRFGEF